MNILIVIYAVLVPVHFGFFYWHDKDLIWHKNFAYNTDEYKISWKSIILKSVGFPVFWGWFVIKMIVGMVKDNIDMKKTLKELEEAETVEDIINLTDKAFEILDRQ